MSSLTAFNRVIVGLKVLDSSVLYLKDTPVQTIPYAKHKNSYEQSKQVVCGSVAVDMAYERKQHTTQLKLSFCSLQALDYLRTKSKTTLIL